MPVSLIAWSTLSRIGVNPGAFVTGGLAYEMRRAIPGWDKGVGTVGCKIDASADGAGSCTRGTGVSLRDGETLSVVCVVRMLGLRCRESLMAWAPGRSLW